MASVHIRKSYEINLIGVVDTAQKKGMNFVGIVDISRNTARGQNSRFAGKNNVRYPCHSPLNFAAEHKGRDFVFLTLAYGIP